MSPLHRLAPLLAPRTVALIGASPKPLSLGNETIRALRQGGYGGALYLVNPNYAEIDGLKCYPTMAALPEAVDLAVLAVAGSRLEGALADVIANGGRSAVIFDSCYVEEEANPKLLDRLKTKAKAVGLPVCGGNGMGFYNFAARTHVSFQAPPDRPAGSVALIAHSGSVFVLLANSDARHRFNLVVSPGQEINGTVADYIDYALEQPSTKVIALFLETVRDPQGFVAALRKAQQRRIPIVALRVGRTEASAQFAATHCGAIAGSRAGFDALFDRYEVCQVDTLDELLATALLLSTVKQAGVGDLAMVTDSGGLRELLVDRAEARGVSFATLSAGTMEQLARRLPHGLEAANPLDCAGPLRADFAGVFMESLKLLSDDPATAVMGFEFEVRDDFVYMPALLEAATSMPAYSDKPFFVFNSFAGTQNARTAAALLEAGVPVINGTETMLTAVRHLLAYRDFHQRDNMKPQAAPAAGIVRQWTDRLAAGGALGEVESLALLEGFGMATAAARPAASLEVALAAAAKLGYPVVLKTAAAGIHHKSDVGGVKLGIAGANDLAVAYRDLSARLGPDVTVEPMIEGSVELAFGALVDLQFGPLVMVGAGGRLVEIMNDRCFVMPPFDEKEARRLLDRLRLRPLLDGVRGAAPANLDKLAESLARFSVLAATLAGSFREIDVNPVIAGTRAAVAVDALVIGGSAPRA